MDILHTIRTNAKKNFRVIIGHMEEYHLKRKDRKAMGRPSMPLCLFCGTDNGITKEHVLPRWVFEKHPDRNFKTTINGLLHKYNQTTLPACSVCNNELLSRLESEILQLFINHNLPKSFFSNAEFTLIISWLEILDYKFQVFSLVTKFKVLAGRGFIPCLEDFSLSVLDPNIQYSPTKVMQNLRKAFRRITIKSKVTHINSLVIFRSSNPDISFFHKSNDFMFLELPRHKISVLYFYEETFDDVYLAKDAAMELIKKHYK